MKCMIYKKKNSLEINTQQKFKGKNKEIEGHEIKKKHA